MNVSIANLLPEITSQEHFALESITHSLNDEQLKNFAAVYRSRRKDPQTILILTILGFFAIAGIQRILLDQVAMGIAYILTGGFCFIGTVIDLVNYQDMTLQYNKKQAEEAVMMVERSRNTISGTGNSFDSMNRKDYDAKWGNRDSNDSDFV